MIRSLIIISLSCSVFTIKVPLSPVEDTTEIVSSKIEDTLNKKPIYYESDESEVDSYLIPPNPHNHDQVSDTIATPATYLLPPLPNSESEYYLGPTESAVQTDWYPIIQALPKTKDKLLINQPKSEDIPIYISDRSQYSKPVKVKNVDDATLLNLKLPSRQLLPPKHDYYIPAPATELELPAVKAKQQFVVPAPLSELQLPKLEKTQEFKPLNKIVPLRFNPAEPTLALDLVPPPVIPIKYKNPTKLYPKKYSNSFKPIPIPISQFAEDDNVEVPIAKPLKPFKPSSSSEEDYTSDEKKIYLYEQADLKRQNNVLDQSNEKQDISELAESQPDGGDAPEQDVSETGYRHAQPLREPTEKTEEEQPTPPAPKDRTEFRMHGMKGPHSYQFGYDTGKGANRQFRYEERDNDGHVKGHYGYMDRSGKLRVVNYDAHPEHGFHADAPQ